MTLLEEKLKDVQDHPERHRHDFDDLHRCCIVDGVIELRLLDAHERYASLGTNGGRRCDTISGPCSCGAWHKPA
jgi:hypothetical protein